MWLYGWELVVVCHHPDKFGDHRHCDNWDLTFLICHQTSRNHLLKWQCDFKGGSPLPYVSTVLILLASGIAVVEINVFTLSRDLARPYD